MRSTICSLAAVAVLLSACSSNYNSQREMSAEDVTQAADSTNFSNDIHDLNSASRKRVRTADVRCRVQDVFQASSKMEHVVKGLNGIVVESTMQQSFGAMKEVPYAGDSIKRVQIFNPTANLTLRVPASALDSVVQTLTAMAAFIDYRTLKEEDKTLAYLRNSLHNKLPQHVPIKPDSTITSVGADQYLTGKQEMKINRQIANLAILDEANFATLSVQLTQPQQVDVQVVVDPHKVMQAGFGTEVLLSLRGGLDTCRNVVLFLLQLWPFILACIAGWWGYRKMKKLAA